MAVERWARLVRGKVLGELLGLAIAVRAPCSGASLVLLSHLGFWGLGAANARVDAAAGPAPLPPPLAKVIATADAVVLSFAALGVLGPTSGLRAAGSVLFAVAAAAVSAEAVKKAAVARRGASTLRTGAVATAKDGARRTAAPQMTATTSTTVETEADAAATKIWAEQWWPLGFAAHTSRAAPVAVTLLGAPLVVWWDDSAGAWRCTLDRCSHRLAPLSEGRVTSDGCIECPYHGWAFDGQGQCVRVPQQEEGSAPCRSRRAAVLALPIMEAQGVIWVWGGGLFESAAVTPPEDSGPALVDVLERPGVEHSDYSRDLHMDWSTLCENVMDPAHLPFTHHKTISRRSKAAPISFGALENFSHTGFTAVRQTAGGPGRLTFRAPLLVLAETHRGPDSYSDWNVVYAVPTEPGKCRLLVRVVFEVSKLPIPLKWVLSFAFTKQPTWWTHLGTHQILEDDNPFLHAQGHAYRAGHATKLAPDWKRRLYMPTASDGMVVAFRRWLDAYSDGEGALWSRVAPTTETPLRRASKEEVLERYLSHVAHCSACSGALRNIRTTMRLAEGGVVLGLLLAALRVRARPAALALAALSFGVARLCAVLDARMRVGRYPPPRNVS